MRTGREWGEQYVPHEMLKHQSMHLAHLVLLEMGL
jgi:hypothetical protein